MKSTNFTKIRFVFWIQKKKREAKWQLKERTQYK